MAEKKEIKKIGIFGYFGAWNLGDEAVVGVLIENIRRRHPKAEISAICLVPENAAQQHGIPAYPLRRMARNQNAVDEPASQANSPSFSFSKLIKNILRRLSVIAPKEFVFLFHSYRQLRGYDMIVVGGSGQLIDNEGGAWNHPYNHFKWSILAKLVGAKFIFLSVGAGPLNTWLGKRFIEKSLSMAQYRSFRDEFSKDLALKIGVKGDLLVYPDQAFGIRAQGNLAETRKNEKEIIVGVAPIAYCDPRHWNEQKQEAYLVYLEKITSFVHWLAENNHKVVLFHTQVHGDDRTIDEILTKLPGSSKKLIGDTITVHPVQWFPDALKAISKTDIVVASRFHAVIFSYVLNRPVIAVSYDPKINNAMASVGQGHFALDIDRFTVEELQQKFDNLKKHIPENTSQLHEKAMEFQKRIQHQYDQVFGQEVM